MRGGTERSVKVSQISPILATQRFKETSLFNLVYAAETIILD